MALKLPFLLFFLITETDLVIRTTNCTSLNEIEILHVIVVLAEEEE